MNEQVVESAHGDTDHGILDLRSLPLDTVLEAHDSVLDNALRKVREQWRHPGENYAAHGTTP